MYQQSKLSCSPDVPFCRTSVEEKNWSKPANRAGSQLEELIKRVQNLTKYNKKNSVHKSSLSFIHSSIVLGGKTFLSLYEIFLGLVSPLSGSVADTTLI